MATQHNRPETRRSQTKRNEKYLSILGFPFITFEEGIFRHSTATASCLAAANVFVSEALIYARHFGYASLPPSLTRAKAVPLAASAAGLSLRSYPSMMRRPNSPQGRNRKGAGIALASAVALTRQKHAENELCACSEWSVQAQVIAQLNAGATVL